MKTLYNWNTLPWKSIESKVFKIQVKIYKYSKSGEKEKMYKLQKSLIKLPAAKLLSVRKVTQDNRGKQTPGVDGVKDVPVEERSE